LAQSGRLDAAKEMLTAFLKTHPGSFEALSLMAKIAGVMRDFPNSKKFFLQALQLEQRRADLFYDYGSMLAASGDYQAAVPELAKAVELDPQNPDYHYNLGCAWSAIENHAGAVEAFRSTLKLSPDLAKAWQNLGHSYISLQDWPLALEAFTQLRTLDPVSEDGRLGLILTLRVLDRNEEADQLQAEAIADDPSGILAQRIMSMDLRRSGASIDEAALWAAHHAAPLDAQPLINLAIFLQRHERLPEIVPQLIEGALENGNDSRLMTLTGLALVDMGDFGARTESILLHADALGGDFHNPCNGLGYLYLQRGNLNAATHWMRKAHEHAPKSATIHSNLLFALRHSNLLTPDELFAEHRRFGEIQETHCEPMELPPLTPADADRKLRIGFVSPDLRNHPVVLFFEPYLDNIDRSQFHVTLYYTRGNIDHVTLRLKSKCDEWRHIYNLGPEDGAKLVRDDNIDILIDLAGHTANNGLPIFLRRPAHLQVSWLGYPGTTGLTRMDYRFAPLYEQPWSTEKIIEHGGSAFRPPLNSPEVAPQPALSGAPFTFACLNKGMKASDAAFETWARILQRTPGSRFIMMASSAEIDATQEHVLPIFYAHGIAPERIIIRERRPLIDFLKMLSEVDLALDPFPYNGGTTSRLTLWMGVPYVTLYGETEASRGGKHLLSAVGLGEFVAQSQQAYEDIAVDFAQSPERLAAIRSDLRERMQQTPVMNEKNAAIRFQAIIRSLWNERVKHHGVTTSAVEPA